MSEQGANRDSEQSGWANFDPRNTAPATDDPIHELARPKVESTVIRGVTVRAGDRVRLLPHRPADIMDLALKQKVAIIEAIECDFDNRLHLAVVLEDDPGRDLGLLRQPGHRFFFSPEEVEPLTTDENTTGGSTHER